MITENTTIKELLQLIDCLLRDQVHPNAWVNALMSQYKPLKEIASDGPLSYYKETDKYPNWIITDTRFPNEAEAVKQRDGLLIRIERPQYLDTNVSLGIMKSHSSETALDNYSFDEVVHNNGSLEELYEQAKLIVTKYKLHEPKHLVTGY